MNYEYLELEKKYKQLKSKVDKLVKGNSGGSGGGSTDMSEYAKKTELSDYRKNNDLSIKVETVNKSPVTLTYDGSGQMTREHAIIRGTATNNIETYSFEATFGKELDIDAFIWEVELTDTPFTMGWYKEGWLTVMLSDGQEMIFTIFEVISLDRTTPTLTTTYDKLALESWVIGKVMDLIRTYNKTWS